MGCFTSKRHQQDSLQSWMVLLTATFSDALTLAMSYCFSVILPVLVKEFNQTREKVAWISSISFSLAYLMSPLSALMCSCFGSRVTAVIGALICTTALVCSSFVSSLYWLYLTYGLLFGTGANILHVPGILLLQRYFKKRRSLATGIFSTSSSYSAMLGPLFQFLIDKFGWRKAFWTIGLSFLAPLALILIFYSADVDDGLTNAVDKGNKKRTSLADRCRKMSLSYWNAWFALGVVGIALQSVGIYPPLSHMIKHANEVGYPASKSSMMLIYIGITSLIGKVVAGRILDSPKTCVFWLNQFSAILMVIAIVILKYATNDVTFISFAVLYGYGNGSFLASMYVLWLTTVAPEHRSAGLATGEVFVAFGVLVGSPFIGFLADTSESSYHLSFLVSAAILFGATMVLFLRFCFKKPVVKYNERTSLILLDTFNVKDLEFLDRETVL